MSAQEEPAMDQDLGNVNTNAATTNGDTTNGDTAVTEKKTVVEGDTTTITETRTETHQDGTMVIETKTLTESQVESMDNAQVDLEESREASEGGLSPQSDKFADGVLSGGSEPQDQGDDANTSTNFEDNLPTYQPPKRVAKTEVKENKNASGVVIMPSLQDENGDVLPMSSTEPPKQSRFKFGGAGQDNICKVCQKRVYELEKIIANKDVYHKTCFRCNHCNRVLTLGNFASIDGNLYCKPHFIEMFKTKGNYEEGFGKERKTKQWPSKEPSPDSSVKSSQLEEDSRTPDMARDGGGQ